MLARTDTYTLPTSPFPTLNRSPFLISLACTSRISASSSNYSGSSSSSSKKGTVLAATTARKQVSNAAILPPSDGGCMDPWESFFCDKQTG